MLSRHLSMTRFGAGVAQSMLRQQSSLYSLNSNKTNVARSMYYQYARMHAIAVTTLSSSATTYTRTSHHLSTKPQQLRNFSTISERQETRFSELYARFFNPYTINHPFVTLFSIGVAELATSALFYSLFKHLDISMSSNAIAAVIITLPIRSLFRPFIWAFGTPLVNRALPFANHIKFSKILKHIDSSRWRESRLLRRAAETYTSFGSMLAMRYAGLVVFVLAYIATYVYKPANPERLMPAMVYNIQKGLDWAHFADTYMAFLASALFFPVTAFVGVGLAQAIVRSGRMLSKRK